MIAVITGDLVHSSGLTGEKLTETRQLMEDKLTHMNELATLRWEFYRGDSFQIELVDAHYAARLALLLISALRAIDVKMTLSLGLGEYRLLDSEVSASQGEAFELSGRGLDSSARGEFSFHSAKKHFRDSLELSTKLISFLLRSMTAKQAQALSLYIELDFPEHQAIANRLGTTRQNITTHLKRAGADLHEEYVRLYERLTKE